jgi:hypothetical protein
MDGRNNMNKVLSQPNDVETLISQLEQLLAKKHPFIKSINRPKVLISALKQLNELIEMDTFKTSVIETIHGLMLNVYCQKNGNKKNKFDNQMLHFCNYGDPGTGKTRASKILAKVLYGLGIDFGNETQDKPDIKDEKHQFYTDKLEEITSLLIEIKQHSALAQNEFKTLKDAYARKQVVPSNMKNDTLTRKEGARIREESLTKSSEVTSSSSSSSAEKSAGLQDKLNTSWKELNASLCGITESITVACETAADIGEELQVEEDEKVKKEIDIDDDPNVQESVYCVVCGKNELVAKFAGQTSGLAYDFLMANRFKTVIIEEAYELYTSDKDGYGAEALVQINRFMDEHPDWIVIGFNGYREKLEETIFHAQPGLRSRISHFFYMSPYTAKGLAKIFILQLESIGLKLDPNINLEVFFEENYGNFTSFGRDTLQFSHQVKKVYFSSLFNDVFNSVMKDETKQISFTINQESFDNVFRRYKELSFKHSLDDTHNDL